MRTIYAAALALFCLLPAFSVTAAAQAQPAAAPRSATSEQCARPKYPNISLRNEESGTVMMAFLVDVDGTVVDSKVTSSSGSRDLDLAALGAFVKCRFKPAMSDGVAVKAWISLQYVWSLE